jgi:hypothetical protein
MLAGPGASQFTRERGATHDEFRAIMPKTAVADVGAAREESVAPWQVGDLPAPPRFGWRQSAELIGPGVLVAGSAIGAGEWLFGPAVTAQYGGTFLWLATFSIVFQIIYNLEVMRYALYCGEPIFIGFFRTPPAPIFWLYCYMFLFLAHIWPFMASNAAVPLASAVIGHLPGDRIVDFSGLGLSEKMLVKLLGYAVFFAAFLPLIFGGKISSMLEAVMVFKLVVVFGFLVVVAVFMVSARNALEIVTGFLRVGSVALRADTVVAAPHFSLCERDGPVEYTVQGTLENGEPVITAWMVRQGGSSRRFEPATKLIDGSDADSLARSRKGETPREPLARAGFREGEPVSATALPDGEPFSGSARQEQLPPTVAPSVLESRFTLLTRRAAALARRGGFFVESVDSMSGNRLSVEGTIRLDNTWQANRFCVTRNGQTKVFERQEDVPAAYSERFRAWVANQGFERIGLASYWWQHGRLPDVDWALLSAFAAIAGAGGLSNALFSNYARDKGWGMGAKVGAIPSAVGGRTIGLSHVGMVFPITPEAIHRWNGWIRHILRDQVAVWMPCSVIGLALPCMLSLEFLRNTPVAEHRVAAMTAQGMALQFPGFARPIWSLVLFVSFLALAPCAVYSGDLLARHWTDILWVTSPRVKRLAGGQVRSIYYSLLGVYAVWGTVTLTFLSPLQIAKVGAVLGNVALGFSAFHTLYVNRTLLPRELQPNPFMQLGLLGCGAYFFAITAMALWGR